MAGLPGPARRMVDPSARGRGDHADRRGHARAHQLAVEAVDLVVTTVRCVSAARRAARGLSIAGQVHAVIALLAKGAVHVAIPAVGAVYALSRAAAVGGIRVVGPVVTGFGAVDDPVPASWRALGAGAVELADGELVTRLDDLSFGLEDDDLVDLAHSETEGRGRRRVERDAAGLRAVHAAQVHRQLAVHEDPHIVVADEGQALATLILEPVADLAGEAEVVLGTVHGAGLEPWDFRSIRRRCPAPSVEGEEGRGCPGAGRPVVHPGVVVDVGAVGLRDQG